MKKMLGLSLATIITISMMATGTWAYFQDGEASDNNSLTAGTLDLKTNDADGVTATLSASNLKPGSTGGPSTITLRNSGSLNASYLGIVFSYSESDGSPNAINMTADQTAAVMEVTTLTYAGANLLAAITDGNSNGYKDLQDLKNASLTALAGINGGASKDFTITIKLRTGISNNFQADGINITMTFTLSQ